MKTKTEHTPTPWRTGDLWNTVFGPPNGNPCPEIVATVHGPRKANAEFIVRACNCHEDLLEACKIALPLLEKLFEVSQAIDGIVDSCLNLESDIGDVRDAIDKAEPAQQQ